MLNWTELSRWKSYKYDVPLWVDNDQEVQKEITNGYDDSCNACKTNPAHVPAVHIGAYSAAGRYEWQHLKQ